jgi:hypothetical protein
MSQTTLQNSACLRFGSGKLQIDAYGQSFGSLVDLGALRDIKISEGWSKVKIDSNNAGRLVDRIKDQIVTLDAIWLEPDFAKINTMRGDDLDNYAAVAGDPVVDHNQYVASGAWAYLGFVPFDKQQGAGTVPTNITVSGSVDGALVADTDYFVMKQAGVWGLYIKDTATVTTLAQVLTIQFDYTPAASKTFSSGGGRELGYIEVRFTNTDENGKTWVIDIYKASVTKGMEITTRSDDGDDVMGYTIQIEGTLDVTRSAANRDQLYKVTDSQGV